METELSTFGVVEDAVVADGRDKTFERIKIATRTTGIIIKNGTSDFFFIFICLFKKQKPPLWGS
jgi:hypothetical protein